MKSTAAILSVFALLVCASCAKENFGGRESADQDGVASVISAAIAKAEVSKTWVDSKVGGSSLPVYWSDGDAINVNGQTSSLLTVSSGAKLSAADFNLRSVAAPYNVIYPSDIVISEVYDAEGSVEIELPDTQAYNPDTFASGLAVLYGYGESEGSTVEMKNLCSAIRVTLKSGSSDAICEAGLRSLGENAPVAGNFKLTPSTGGLQVLQGTSSLSLDIAESVVLDRNGKDFWFTLPAGNFAGGFTITFTRNSDRRKMVCSWTPSEALLPGVIYHFSNVDFVPGAKDIETPDDWEEFALAYNSGEDISQWLDRNGVIHIGRDIEADNLTVINELFDTTVIDGQGFSVKRNAATGPLFKKVAGTVKNICTEGAFSAEKTPHRSAPIADELFPGGRIEGCTNLMDIDAALVADHIMLAGIVRQMDGGTISGCENRGNITGRPDVSAASYNCQIAGIVAQVYPDEGESVLIENCTNCGTLIQLPKSPTKHAFGVTVSGLGGIAGWLRYREETYFTLDNCDNKGTIYFDGHNITDETGMAAYTISVGGIVGLAANINITAGTLVVPNGTNGINLVLKDCDNTGMVRNCGANYSASSSSTNKSFSGGIAGTLVGNAEDGMSSLVNCTNKGDVIPYDLTTEDMDVPSARPAYCSVIGGLVGFGGYLKIEGCTVNCRLGNGKRLVACLGGAIGYNIRPFKITGCSFYYDGYFQRITGYKSNRSVIVTVPVKYTGGSAMSVAPDIKGSVISGCRAGATLQTNKNTVTNANFDKDRSDLTKNSTYTVTTFDDESSALGNLVSGEGFAVNPEDIAMENNTFWQGI